MYSQVTSTKEHTQECYAPSLFFVKTYTPAKLKLYCFRTLLPTSSPTEFAHVVLSALGDTVPIFTVENFLS